MGAAVSGAQGAVESQGLPACVGPRAWVHLAHAADSTPLVGSHHTSCQIATEGEGKGALAR